MLRTRVTIGVCAGAVGAWCLTALLLAAPNDARVADAAMRGDADAVRGLLKDAADVNAAQGDGMTALHWAAMRGDAQLVQMLIYAGANLDATTRIGAYTPLYLAARDGRAGTVKILLAAGADPKAATQNGTTPLMVAAASGSVEAVTALIDKGADVNAAESVRGETPLMFAAASDRAPVIDVLAKHGADVKAATKVIDLAALSRDPAKLDAIRRGNPPPPPKEGEKPAQAAQGGQTPPSASAGAPAKENAAPPPKEGAAARPGPPPGRGRPQPRGPQIPGVTRSYQLNELVSAQGGMTPLLLAARDGSIASVRALLAAGADVNQASAGDKSSPLLVAVINGQYDVAKYLLDHGGDPNLAADNGAAPLYAVLNCEWSPKALYPQPRAFLQQHITYLDLMKALLDKGADPNARLTKKVWYSGYSFDLSGVDETGATPFWRAAYGADVDAMKLLVAYGADPNIPTVKPAARGRFGDVTREVKDVSGLPPVPVGGPGLTPLLAASGAGYSEGFAANSHHYAPTGMLAAVKYLVDVLHADVNAHDHEGHTALHNAASRGDNEMILYLVSKGADVAAVTREGQTVADMANGPVQRTQPFPETVALLEKLGSKNNHHCVSCD
ncbi:MAG: ankyrin repeat domain-containing protein [Betaproteobacteria bacterium]